MKAIGSRRLQLEFLNPDLPEARLVPEVFRQQWRENLGIELILVTQEVQTWIQSIYSHNYTVAGCADYGGYLDPTWFLDSFTSQSTANTTPWTDPRYDEMLARARSTTDRGSDCANSPAVSATCFGPCRSCQRTATCGSICANRSFADSART